MAHPLSFERSSRLSPLALEWAFPTADSSGDSETLRGTRVVTAQPPTALLLAVAESAYAFSTRDAVSKVTVVPQASHPAVTSDAGGGSKWFAEEQGMSLVIRVTSRYRSKNYVTLQSKPL